MTSKLVDEIGQFTTIPNWVIDRAQEIGTDGLALFVALRYFGPGAFPSYDTIQEKSGMTRRRIAAAIRVLEKAGMLERKKRFSKSTVYALKTSISTPPVLLDAPISTASVLPVVQQVHANKINLTRLNKVVVVEETPETSERPNIYTQFERTIGPLYPAILMHLDAAAEKYAPEWIEAAFDEAAQQGARSWKYVNAILQSWERNGFQADTRKKETKVKSLEDMGYTRV